MGSEANVPVPTTAVNNSTALIVNGSTDGDVIPNGDVVSMSEVTAPPAHDQVASAGAVEFMAYSLNLLTVVKDPISQDEVALYDRQIRLWGLQAQEKLGTLHRIQDLLLTCCLAYAKRISSSFQRRLWPMRSQRILFLLALEPSQSSTMNSSLRWTWARNSSSLRLI